MSKQDPADKADNKAAETKPELTVLSKAKRDGVTVRVVTDGVRVWKDSIPAASAGSRA